MLVSRYVIIDKAAAAAGRQNRDRAASQTRTHAHTRNQGISLKNYQKRMNLFKNTGWMRSNGLEFERFGGRSMVLREG